MVNGEALVFEVVTPLGFWVRVEKKRWHQITNIKHPAMRDRETDVQQALKDPDEVRRSRRDREVYLFYRRLRVGRWTCAVAKRTGGDGFLVTCYPTDAIKEGDCVWTR